MTGKKGELCLFHHFQENHKAGRIADFRWVSCHNAIAPYDFWVKSVTGETVLIDAKSTQGPFQNPIHVSLGELYEMAASEHEYRLYRLYELHGHSARLRVSSPMKEVALSILSVFESLPAGVKADSVSLDPLSIPFEEEVITIPDTSAI